MMRFKKGNKVEVWNRRGVPSGSWQSAEIISGDGHTYSVRYDGYPTDSSVAVHRVSRKAIRPCPPPSDDLKELRIGDVVEVFDKNSWKLAEVRTTIDQNNYSLMLLESFKELRVHKSFMRKQLSWHDNQCMVIHKDSGKQNDRRLSSSVRGGKSGCRILQSHEKLENYSKRSNFPMVLPRIMKKRTLDISISANSWNGGRKKKIAIGKDGSCQRITVNPLKRTSKVDDTTSGRLFGEKYMDCFLNSRTCSSRIESGRIVPHSDEQKYILSSVNSDAESISSSVGSCSVDSSPCGSLQDNEEVYSQTNRAETSCSYERDSSPSNMADLQSEIHLLELAAYRSTLTAMYVSGPGQSWRLLSFASIGL
ncbi:uncharacterized protein LOC122038667 isoform X1 [Zingiber officinale]|uniref:uncharacterized protein LOC122038667 isoform X1 n=1 Tax=Zingiber officinale TaxID=94328 RepID=UPI001C4A9A17|nr:uncharacterized protein LOC122038667 isoform X1 [Zingiber officinale]XP_042454449.1 uncharacterized protein LOC122038667 isoform X1 [Zingiber officinale]XP_042454450.1 uncharacterized protein LOC122038667 isoform X1 [Zingiber officinale]XP_042454451.1 uncharacterized protein LOC122038667 isoform X1 [Zingiber officinale]XP_042454452.1 uncharacterized protein LOC122038667 isoform X1 [Zingiber officinale]XP_042454453.1 uncharacterized protein LOC122038667 isoform X1 [Zingiber officinale]XP_04